MSRRAEASLAAHEAESVEALAELHVEHHRNAAAAQRVIDGTTRLLGRPLGLLAVALVMAAWIVVAVAVGGGRVEGAWFAWLELAATLSALLISLLILITQRREDQLAERRAQLTREMAILADRKTAKIIALLEALLRDTPGLADSQDAEAEAMQTPADPERVLDAIDAETPGGKT